MLIWPLIYIERKITLFKMNSTFGPVTLEAILQHIFKVDVSFCLLFIKKSVEVLRQATSLTLLSPLALSPVHLFLSWDRRRLELGNFRSQVSFFFSQLKKLRPKCLSLCLFLFIFPQCLQKCI